MQADILGLFQQLGAMRQMAQAATGGAHPLGGEPDHVRLVLRLPEELHARLYLIGLWEGLSTNRVVVSALLRYLGAAREED